MDSMDVNKAIAAVLVAGIAFFVTGWIGDNLVYNTPLEKSALKIEGMQKAATSGAAQKAGLPPIAPLLASADVKKGEAFVNQVCAACHSFNKGGKPIVGPNLYGIVGAPHDHEAGFAYSAALEKFKGQPWTYDALNKWLDKPAAYAPGTHMTFAGIPNAKTRADVIAYLRTVSDHPEPLPKVEAAPAKAAAPKPAGSGLDARLAKADIAKGKQYATQTCGMCHSLNEGGKPIVGPNLYGIVGAPHDHEAGFAYSAALEKFKGKPWTFAALDDWLTDPAKYAPGTHMTFSGIPNPQLRADVIGYLDTLSHHPVPLPKAEAAPAKAPAPAPAKEAAAAPAASGLDALLAKADVAKGKQFATQTCGMCHSLNKGGKPIVGPNLYGIVDAPHDHEAGFAYSAALEKFKGKPWTFAALNEWLTDPAKYAPGTHMTYQGIPNAQTRADVIAYLDTLADKPVPLPKAQAAPAKAPAPAPAAEKTPAPAPAKEGAAAPAANGLDARLAKADAAKGKQFAAQTCAMCHSLDKGGKPIVGPNLYGIVDAPHDHEAGFAYSAALEKFKGKPWTFAALDDWLKDPAKYAPGTHMTYEGIPNAQTRADVIAYLATLADKPVPLPKAGASSGGSK